MRRAARYATALVIVLAFLALPACATGTEALEDAYARGFADGVQSVKDGPPADNPYWEGYQDGLAAADDGDAQAACQRCYGQGFSDGYEIGVATGKSL